MSSALCLSSLLRSGRRGLPSLSSHQQQQLRLKHQVRVIITHDLPDGQMRGVYAGEVHNVAAGYARNYLVPGKMAVYATPRNFERCGLIDPDIAAKEEAAQQKLLAGDDEENEDLKAADLLRRYLRNKVVRVKRNVDPQQPIMCHPAYINHENLREKLLKQLKIDLEDHETIHIRNELVMGLEEKGDAELMRLLKEMDEEDVPVKVEASDGAEEAAPENTIEDNEVGGGVKECGVKVKQLGDYVAKITLAGGYVVPLKFNIGRR